MTKKERYYYGLLEAELLFVGFFNAITNANIQAIRVQPKMYKVEIMNGDTRRRAFAPPFIM